MLVGYADNPKGVTIGGVQILPGTTIGVYWRVYSLPYTRFCIVSPPRIIGTFSKQPLPPKWAAHWPGRSALLEQLRLYFVGKLESYIVKPTSVHLETLAGMTVTAAANAGVYVVSGTNEDGLPALARIDKSGGVALQVLLPDLAVSGVAVSTTPTQVTPPAFTDDQWSVSATLTNEGTAQATSIIVQYWLSTSATLDTATAKLLDTSPTIHDLQAGTAITVASPQSYSVDKDGNGAGTYYIFVTAASDSKNGEIDLTDNSDKASIDVNGRALSNIDLTVGVSTADPVPVGGVWSFSATVTNSGTGTAGPSILQYKVKETVVQVQVEQLGPHGHQTFDLSGNVSDLATAPGTYHVSLTADALNAVAESNESNNTADAAIQVIPNVDLTVSVSSVTPVPAHLGGTWSFIATVKNSGTGTAGESKLAYTVGTTSTQVDVLSIGPGGSQTFSLTGNVNDLASAPGTYHISLTADALNAVAESNESNNTADAAVQVINDVDLTVSVSQVTPAPLGGTWSFIATVKNSGMGTAGPSTLAYAVNNTLKEVLVGSIAPNLSQSFTLSGNVSDLASAPGTYHISLAADAFNAVTETNETNNSADAAIQVTYVDLTVSITNIANAHRGGGWSFNATVTNSGTGTAGESKLEYTVGTSTIGTRVDVGSIGPGGSQTFYLSGTLSQDVPSGFYHIAVVADALNTVLETNENNNTADAAVPVIYDEIVIDTYNPSGSGADAINPTIVKLYDANGTLLAKDNDESGTIRPVLTDSGVDWPGQGYGYIDCKLGLPPGDYFILVEESSSLTDPFGYGIRALTAPSISYGTAWAVGTPTETESDSPLIGGGTPRANQLMTLNVPLGRWIIAGGVNWIKLTLP
jgi:subtilase family serine protease